MALVQVYNNKESGIFERLDLAVTCCPKPASKTLSARLFQLFGLKKSRFDNSKPKSLFGEYKTQLFRKSCVL